MTVSVALTWMLVYIFISITKLDESETVDICGISFVQQWHEQHYAEMNNSF